MTMATPATMSPIRTDVTSTRAGRLSVESKCEKDKNTVCSTLSEGFTILINTLSTCLTSYI